MSTYNKARDRGPDGKLLRKYRRTYSPAFASGCPKWWRKLFMTRPRRHDNKHACRLILKGRDPDGLVLPVGNCSLRCSTSSVRGVVGNCKPHVYYW